MTKKKLSIQEYLSLGYIYLILLGLSVEVIYYKFLGINILNYSSILDVLISPINILTRNAKLFFFIVIFLIVFTFFMLKTVPKVHVWFKKMSWYHKMYDMEKLDAKYLKETEVEDVIHVFALMLFSMFLGLSLGTAGKVKKDIDNNTFKITHSVTFQNGEKKKVKIIGQNSSYMFYLEKGDKEVAASPIEQNVVTIRRLPKKTETEKKN